MTRPTTRGGVAAVWVVVVFAVLAVLSAGFARQAFDLRRAEVAREARSQATWLARSGVELAAAKLRDDGDKYAGEKATLVPGSVVAIHVSPDGDAKDRFRVESEATVRPSSGTPVVRKLTRVVRRDGTAVEVRPGK